MTIILHFYPNGEFTQGYSAPKKEKRAKVSTPKKDFPWLNATYDERISAYKEYADMTADMQDPRYWSVGSIFMSRTMGEIEVLEVHSDMAVIRWYDTSECEHISRTDWDLKRTAFELGWIPIGLSNSRILTEPHESRKKCLQMTKNMSRNIRNACYLLEERYGKDRLSFLTLTLPNVSKDTLARICDNWDTCVHRLLKWMRSKLEKIGATFEYVYCTEIQTQRLQNRGEYAPHLHMVFTGRASKKSPWYFTPKQLKKAWVRAFQDYCDCEFDSSAIENVQRIKYSASRYLAKYLSKSAHPCPQGDAGSSFPRLRTHWGGMARSLGRLVKKSTVYLGGGCIAGVTSRMFLRAIERMCDKGYIQYWKRLFIDFGGTDGNGKHGIHVGYGVLATPTFRGGLTPCIEHCLQFEQAD